MLASLEAVLLSALAVFLVSLFVPYLEFRLFFLGLALFGIGAFAGRKTYLGSLGFMGAYLGAFVGFYLSEIIFWSTNPMMELTALSLALASGLGGFVTGKLGVRKLERIERFAPGVRRCSNCGARVGTSAHKCWSCKATLTY
jgi:hypothetical protein